MTAPDRDDPQPGDDWPGWSGAALVVRGSEVLQERSVGSIGAQGSAPCSPRSRYQACSISKLVLSVAALALVESGSLALDRPISAWLDDLPSGWSSITLHHLLSNTSGMGHWGQIPGLPALLTAPPPEDRLRALIDAAPLLGPPGADWHYSGPGFLTAGRVVEAAAGRPYAAVVSELVLGPARMTDSSSGAAPDHPDLAIGHERGELRPLHPHFAAILGSGDLWTTPTDLVRLAQALRDGTLVTARSATQLWEPRVALPDPGRDTRGVVVTGYGYGTFVGRVDGRPARINPGDMPGYQSLLAHLPDDDLDLAVMCNEETPSIEAALATVQLP